MTLKSLATRLAAYQKFNLMEKSQSLCQLCRQEKSEILFDPVFELSLNCRDLIYMIVMLCHYVIFIYIYNLCIYIYYISIPVKRSQEPHIIYMSGISAASRTGPKIWSESMAARRIVKKDISIGYLSIKSCGKSLDFELHGQISYSGPYNKTTHRTFP